MFQKYMGQLLEKAVLGARWRTTRPDPRAPSEVLEIVDSSPNPPLPTPSTENNVAACEVLGVIFARSGKVNVNRYGWNGSWRYALQRMTGYLAVAFIFLHITSLRFGWTYLGLMPKFDTHHAASSLAVHFQQGEIGLLLAAFYLVCVLAIVFHFANGLWSAAITWGLTVSRASQARWGYACAALGMGLSTMAVAAITGYSTLDIEAAEKIEDKMNQASETISNLPVDPPLRGASS